MNNNMFEPKDTKNKEPAEYKSLYIKEKLVKEIKKIAKDNNTSFNNVVISMIEKVTEDNKWIIFILLMILCKPIK